MKWVIVMLFVAGAALSWGIYVPVVHRATGMLNSSLRAFLCVGIAYFLVAVLVPVILIAFVGDPTVPPGKVANFHALAVWWGLLAGFAGADGALCVIFASKNAGAEWAPLVVAPLVFGGAPIINTFATIYYFHPVKTRPDWPFFLGIGLAAVGAVLVMIFKPKDESAAPKAVPSATASAEAGAPVH
jgi:hypothetical protein